MSSFTAKYATGIVVAAIIFVVIVAAVHFSGNSGKNKQGFALVSKQYGQMYPSSYGIRGATIGIGAYPPSVDPTYWNTFAMNWPYDPKNGIDEKTAKRLLSEWLDFNAKLSPDVQDAIYALFPGLQGLKSIEYYGLSNETIFSLTKIAPALKHPEKFKTVDDVYQILSPEAIKLFDKQINEKPQTGLYDNVKDMGWGFDVI
jgi:hypothetical protein